MEYATCIDWLYIPTFLVAKQMRAHMAGRGSRARARSMQADALNPSLWLGGFLADPNFNSFAEQAAS